LNNQKDLDLIVSRIETEACYKNPGPAAVDSVEWIDLEYVLIARETLPVLQHPTLDDAFGGDTSVRLNNITEKAFNGDFKKMRDLALQYLVMADFIESKAKKVEETKLKAAQFEAYRILFPNTSMTLEEFDISHTTVSASTRNGIAAIMDLTDRLAKMQLKR
jgi:hypothetical protein